MVHVGIAGIGFMGVTHYKAMQLVTGGHVSAISSRDPAKRAGDWTAVKGNFGGSGGTHDLSGVTCHATFEDLLADDAVDLVDICLPSPTHRDRSIEALEAGRHVLVEKPIALSVADADRMIDAARANDRLLMVGHVLRFWPQWRFLKQALDDGRYGRLRALNLRRIIALPDWSATISDFAANGGPMIDLHIHDVDFLLYLLGRPRRVRAIGNVRDDRVEYVSAIYDYDDGPRVSCQSGAIATAARPFFQAFEACFERATVAFSTSTEPEGCSAEPRRSGAQRLTVYRSTDDGVGAEFPEFDDADGFAPQLQHAVDCVTQGTASPFIDAAQARESLEVVMLEDEAVRSGEPVDL